MQLATASLDKLEKRTKAILDKLSEEEKKHTKLLDEIAQARRSIRQITTALNGGGKPLPSLWTAVKEVVAVTPLDQKYFECAHCFHYKLRASFSRCRNNKTGLQSWCKKCVREYHADRRAKGR